MTPQMAAFALIVLILLACRGLAWLAEHAVAALDRRQQRRAASSAALDEAVTRHPSSRVPGCPQDGEPLDELEAIGWDVLTAFYDEDAIEPDHWRQA